MKRLIKALFTAPTQDEGSAERMKIVRERDNTDAHRRGDIRERLAPSLYPESKDAWRQGRDA